MFKQCLKESKDVLNECGPKECGNSVRILFEFMKVDFYKQLNTGEL